MLLLMLRNAGKSSRIRAIFWLISPNPEHLMITKIIVFSADFSRLIHCRVYSKMSFRWGDELWRTQTLTQIRPMLLFVGPSG